ncbi:serine hydrolase domain-containing protein [Streptomyces sp. NPDC005752]|uniref:serine hydrolase domain-containing protein n=1 Tax=Streptomyces sp. NPDC005752 TaxID=3157065 RepID=UPI0033D892E3
MGVSRRRRRGGLGLAGLAAALLVVSTGPSTAATPWQADPLRRHVEAIHDTGVVGVSAEVTSRHTRDRARAGTARRDTAGPMPRDGSFRIGSATKTFTAAVVLQLVGEGRMSLDDTVEQWLPGVLRGTAADGRLISVRQLLQHTSGVPDVQPEIPALNSAAGYRAQRTRSYTPEELVRLAVRQSPPAAAERDWSYSNTNYVLAAMIIRQVTGHSWAQEVDRRIIRPLGLGETFAPGPSTSVPDPHARSYSSFGTGTGIGIDVTVLDPGMAVGSGSLISTTHDLSRFYSALLGGRLLAPAQLEEMTTTVSAPGLGMPGVRYGLGLGELPLPCGGTYFGHPGELLGYRSWSGVTADGARTAVVYATSEGGPDTGPALSTLVGEELCRSRP